MAASEHRHVLIVIAGPNGTEIISRYDKSIANCIALAPYVDQLYVYDNSIEDAEARLLFRLSNGELVKRYVNDLPAWASPILPQ